MVLEQCVTSGIPNFVVDAKERLASACTVVISMSFQRLVEDQRLKIALERCRQAAAEGKASFFDRW